MFAVPVCDEAARPDGDPSLLDLLDPPPLMETLDAILGGDNIRCIHIQPRTVPPEDEGGYTSWHRVRLPSASRCFRFPALLMVEC